MLLWFSETFQRGKEKLREAELHSDLSTDVEGERKKLRHVRAKKRVFSSSSSSDDNDKNEVCLPVFPKVPRIDKTSQIENNKQNETAPTTSESQNGEFFLSFFIF